MCPPPIKCARGGGEGLWFGHPYTALSVKRIDGFHKDDRYPFL